MNIQNYAKIKDSVVETLAMVEVNDLPEIAGCQLVLLRHGVNMLAENTHHR